MKDLKRQFSEAKANAFDLMIAANISAYITKLQEADRLDARMHGNA